MLGDDFVFEIVFGGVVIFELCDCFEFVDIFVLCMYNFDV